MMHRTLSASASPTQRQAVAAQRRRALLITGGSGPERRGSLASAVDVAAALEQLGVESTVCDLDDLDHAALAEHDLAFLAIHGWYGEDGKLQGLLELAALPYNGSGVAASAVAMHKPLCNRVAAEAGLAVPRWIVLTPQRCDAELLERFGGRVFVKPASGGGSLDAGVVGDVDELRSRCDAACGQGIELLACEHIAGIDVSVGIVECDGAPRVLPELATRHDAEFYDYAVKHDASRRRHECPSRLDAPVVQSLREQSLRMYRALGCRGYMRADFIVDADGRAWFLEVNTLPGLSRAGNLATMAAAAGWTYTELIDHILATIPPRCTNYRP
jgi:D-alanine-D-alanine ligase